MGCCARAADLLAEKKPKEESIHCFEPGEADASMRDVLFFGLMLCVTHHGAVKELNEWATKVVKTEVDAAARKSLWKPSDEWKKDQRRKIPEIFVPLYIAHKEFSWPEPVLVTIARAMQAWRGDGHVDGMTGKPHHN